MRKKKRVSMVVTRFIFNHDGKNYLAVYENGFAPMWAIYMGERKIESKYIRGYNGWGDTCLPSQVKEKFISDLEAKNIKLHR